MNTTKEQFPLSPRKIIKKTLIPSIILTVVFSIVGFSILIASNGNGAFGFLELVLLGILLSLITLIYFYERWYYNTYYYDLGADYIVIKKGPITPAEITIPYERVQDVYVDQDLFDRIFSLYDVHLSSATISSGMAAHIDGVEKPAADGLRAQLLKTVSEKISKRVPVPVAPKI